MLLTIFVHPANLPFVDLFTEGERPAALNDVDTVGLFPVTWSQYAAYPDRKPDQQSAEKDQAEEMPIPAPLGEINSNNWTDLWVQGISLETARAYCKWLGPEYDLPTAAEHDALYQFCSKIPLRNVKFLKTEATILQLVNKLHVLHRPNTLADLALMRRGLPEWSADLPVPLVERLPEGGGPPDSDAGRTLQNASSASVPVTACFRVIKRKPKSTSGGSLPSASPLGQTDNLSEEMPPDTAPSLPSPSVFQSVPQLIYATVRANEWEGGKNGNFMAFRCRERMSEEDMTALMRHLEDALPTDNRQRLAFARLPSGNSILFRAILEDRPDGFGRSGCLLVHILLFTQANWATRENNPFTVLPDFKFFNSMAEVLEITERRSPLIECARVTHPHIVATQQMLTPLERIWEKPGGRKTVRDLLLLATSARPGAARRSKKVNFVGTQEAFLELMSALMLLIPEPLRSYCTFNTAYALHHPSALPYWAVVTDVPLAQQDLYQFHLAQGNFFRELKIDPWMPWQSWIDRTYEHTSLMKWGRQSNPAHFMSEWLLNPAQPFSSDDILDFDLIVDFIMLNWKGLVNRAVENAKAFFSSLEGKISADQGYAGNGWSSLVHTPEMERAIATWLHKSLENRLAYVRGGCTDEIAMTWFTEALLTVSPNPSGRSQADIWIAALHRCKTYYENRRAQYPSLWESFGPLWELIVACRDKGSASLTESHNIGKIANLSIARNLQLATWALNGYQIGNTWRIDWNDSNNTIQFHATFRDQSQPDISKSYELYKLLCALLNVEAMEAKTNSLSLPGNINAVLLGAGSEDQTANLDRPHTRARRGQVLRILDKDHA